MASLIRIDIENFAKAVSEAPTSALSLALHIEDALSPNSPQRDRAIKRIDFIFNDFRAKNSAISDSLEGLAALNNYLFRDLELVKSDETVSQIDSHSVSRLIEKREACPMVLALLYRELGRKLGMSLDFISFPGHFILKILYGHQLYFLNLSQQGRMISVSELQTKLQKQFGPDALLSGHYLETQSEKQIVTSYLNRLKKYFFEKSLWRELLAVLDMLIALSPDRMSEYKERGCLLYQVGLISDASHDLNFYVDKAGPAPEIQKLHGLINQLQHPFGPTVH